jgi:hypothetical protein
MEISNHTYDYVLNISVNYNNIINKNYLVIT